MSDTSRSKKLARFILMSAALLLPSLSLLPLGGLYLWEKGYLLHWALISFAVVAGISLIEYFLLFRSKRNGDVQAGGIPDVGDAADSPAIDDRWNASEIAAWADVCLIARSLDVDQLNSGQSFLDLGSKTVGCVARRLHPEKRDALWQFTMPEAMAISERVSRRLGRLVYSHVPFGDRLTLAQLRAAYRWRGAIDAAERVYDVWRLVRFVNPATAITHEARERLARSMMNWGREHVTRRVAEAFVHEVGRAAIDLYGGRLATAPLPGGEPDQPVEPAGPARRDSDGAVADPANSIKSAGRIWRTTAAARQASTALGRSLKSIVRRSNKR